MNNSIKIKDELIRFAMPFLSWQCKEVLQLKYFENKSNKDIAKELNITPNNVALRVMRGRKELNNWWEKYSKSGLTMKQFQANIIKKIEREYEKKQFETKNRMQIIKRLGK